MMPKSPLSAPDGHQNVEDHHSYMKPELGTGLGLGADVPRDWPVTEGTARIEPRIGGPDRRVMDKTKRNIDPKEPYRKWPGD